MPKIIYILLISLVILAGLLAFLFEWGFEKSNDKSDLIQVNIKSSQEISSPLEITGKARGTWFFEGDFPIKLFDANKQEIAVSFARAQDEWMTTDFVNFKANLEFEIPETETGTLILIKNNVSDKRELDDELRIPIKFKTDVIEVNNITPALEEIKITSPDNNSKWKLRSTEKIQWQFSPEIIEKIDAKKIISLSVELESEYWKTHIHREDALNKNFTSMQWKVGNVSDRPGGFGQTGPYDAPPSVLPNAEYKIKICVGTAETFYAFCTTSESFLIIE